MFKKVLTKKITSTKTGCHEKEEKFPEIIMINEIWAEL